MLLITSPLEQVDPIAEFLGMKTGSAPEQNMHPPLQITVNPDSSSSSFEKPSLMKQESPKSQSPRASTAAGKPKKITWNKRIKVKKVRSRAHYTEEESSSVWYSPEEYVAIKKGCVSTLKMMSKPGFVDCERFSSRGLEVRTKEASRRRKEIKTFAAQSVLDEQEFQDETGEVDPERIREVYRETSSMSESKAQLIGMRDEEVVKEYLKELRQELLFLQENQ